MADSNGKKKQTSSSTAEVFAFRLYPEQMDRLRAAAKREGRTMTALLREALGRHLDQLEADRK